ncbi:MAG: RNA 2',3'-cyclic phosphodiesterase [Oceanospirillaceae bacterium]|uniref:RNA 2',3'-cyclic phosphodiesterase n=1 Tax=Marinobacterium litorale TaxID=404770 RepID=UPI000405F0A5|nr:RNA 2',3'-cyclic phosphodiesterase [Marinobacterium litorale]MBS98542.1 RNA 2',3'-cyclic phosphodiesterase [Oceanospirillaceae bacterium]
MSDQSTSLRLFIAIDLPESLQDRIGEQLPHIPEVRWSPPEQLHMTLAFIGKLEAHRMPALDQALSLIQFEPFTLSLDRIGTFGDHILWIGSANTEALEHLQREVVEALTQAQVEYDDTHPFTPHVTIGRSKEPWSATTLSQVETCLLDSPASLLVDQLVLKNSVRSAHGAIHQVVRLYDAQS